MESLALLVAAIILSFWATAGLCLVFTFLGFRLAGAVLGVLSFLAGAWLIVVLPHVPLLGLLNIAAGCVAIRRYFLWRKNEKTNASG